MGNIFLWKAELFATDDGIDKKKKLLASSLFSGNAMLLRWRRGGSTRKRRKHTPRARKRPRPHRVTAHSIP